MKDKKKLTWYSILVSVPLLVALILQLTGMTYRIEDFFMDQRYKYFNPGNKVSDKVMVVEVDESTLQLYGEDLKYGRWPWKRNVYPEILDFIFKGEPKLVLFDVMFFEKTEFDTPLAESSLILPVSHALNFRREADVSLKDKESMETLKAAASQKKIYYEIKNSKEVIPSPYNTVSHPIPILMENSNHFHVVTYEPDQDGTARRGWLLFQLEDKYYPSLALKGMNAIEEVQEISAKDSDTLVIKTARGEKEVPLEKGELRIHYYSKEEMDKMDKNNRVSMGGIISSIRSLERNEVSDFSQLKVDPNIFRDKVVIIATSAASTYEIRHTPFGDKPGFTYHAIAMSNLIENHFIRLSPKWVNVILLLLTIPTSVYFTLFYQQVTIRIIIPAIILVGYVLIALFAFKLNIHLPMASFSVAYPLSFFGALAYLTLTEGAERRKYSKVLSNMVDPTIVSEALNDLEALKKGGEKEITAFFSDVASFSTISEQLTSAQLAALLNEYLSAMTIILKKHTGTLDKYIGDAIVGIFGAPMDRPMHSIEAARASLKMMEKLAELKEIWTKENKYTPDAQKMNIRIGLNSGIAKVGFMGTDALASYTMMGDTVNLAARLEAAGKDYGVNILISQATKSRVENELFTCKLDAVVVKGKTEPVNIYELIGIKGKVSQNLVEAAGLYEEAFNLYLNRDFKTAISKFELSEKAKSKKDKSVHMLIERCEDYLQTPPPENWNGAYVRTHK